MNILGAADQVLLNITTNQQNLASLSGKLASGLRIQSAADDPSGNAIAQGLQAKVNGLQQSVENVQEGTNLLTVADGAAATIQEILQRMNSLVVESNSDINSNEQLLAIQTEINQLMLEINRISQNANFNGVTLFDGSHDTYVAAPGSNVTFVTINPGLLPDGTIPTSSSVSTPQAPSALLISKDPNSGIEQTAIPLVTGRMSFEVTAAGNNLSDPLLGPVPGSDVILNQILYSPDAAFGNNKGNESIFFNVLSSNAGANDGNGAGVPVSEPTPGSGQSITFDLPNITTADVGVAMGVEIVGPQQSGGGTALTINDGGDEGTTVSISLPTLNTGALQLSGISVLRPTQLDDQFGTGAPTGVDSSNQYAAMDAQFRIQQALEAVAQTRAYIGSQMVATGDDSNNDSIAGMNYTSSESSITDLNVGTAVTQFTQDQILSSVGTSVLSQMQINAKTLSSLLISTFSGGGSVNALA
jgi:flagellin